MKTREIEYESYKVVQVPEMKTKTLYIAEDGTEFDSKDSVKGYEKQLEISARLKVWPHVNVVDHWGDGDSYYLVNSKEEAELLLSIYKQQNKSIDPKDNRVIGEYPCLVRYFTDYNDNRRYDDLMLHTISPESVLEMFKLFNGDATQIN